MGVNLSLKARPHFIQKTYKNYTIDYTIDYTKKMKLLFIKQMIGGDIATCQYWLLAIAIMGVAIIIASIVDLRYGRMASKAAGVYKTTSYGLRKTIYKLKDYLTFLTFGALIDGCASFFFDAPFCSAVVTIGVILIEGISVREKITAIDKGHDPLMAAKAFANAYGLTDADKIEKVLKQIQNEYACNKETNTNDNA